jgi:hypothetical protein
MLNAWERMVDVAELAYDDYMRHIPSHYRQREPGTQVDVVWGNRVIPNFIRTMLLMRDIHLRISKGDLGVWAPAEIQSDIRGASDYWRRPGGYSSDHGIPAKCLGRRALAFCIVR